jgi:DNA-binding transcriptional LysR family regulator
MRRKIDWERQIGRRLRFRDLHVFFTVVERGSMAKAAAVLGVSIPTVSEVIAGLEHGLGVRLLDRSPRGVEPTVYGRAFLKRGLTAFDELKQGIRDIEFLADPALGELRIGCDESISAATLPLIIERFSRQYPGVIIDVDDLPLRIFPPDLREHGYDLVMTRLRGRPLAELQALDDLNVEVLFNDHLVLAAGTQTRWAHRRKIDLAELAGARWILAGPETWNYAVVAEAFRAQGLAMPKIAVKSLSVHIRTNLLAGGDFVTALPRSVLHLYADRFKLKILPVNLPARPWPVILLTLRNRTLTPVVERFIASIREVGKLFEKNYTFVRGADRTFRARART